MKSLEELKAIRERNQGEIGIRSGNMAQAGSRYRLHVLVCGGTGCSPLAARRSENGWKKRLRRTDWKRKSAW